MSLPSFSIDLIKELDHLYPARNPDIQDSDRLIWFKAGQRSVVDRLLMLQQEDYDEMPSILSN